MTETSRPDIFDAADIDPPPSNGAGPDPLTCADCGKHFPRPSGLATHRKFRHRGERKAAPEGAPAERKPKAKAAARVPLAQAGTSLWQGVAFVLARAGKNPASRMMQLQAPAAGPALERALKGTVVDKAVQPFLRMGGGGKSVVTLFGAPASAQAFHDNPTPLTQAAFLGTLEASLPDIVKSMKEAKRRQEKIEADLAEVAELFGKAPGERISTQEIALWILTGDTSGQPPPGEPAPEPEEEPANV